MTKGLFYRAFLDAVETACKVAETLLGRKLDRDIIVRMYGAGVGGIDVSPEVFVDRAYLNKDAFYRLIDIAVVEVVGTRPVVFAWIRVHPPGLR